MARHPSDLVDWDSIRADPGVIKLLDGSGSVIYIGHSKSVEDYVYNLSVRLRWIWDQVGADVATIEVEYGQTYKQVAALAARMRRSLKPSLNTSPDMTTLRIQVPRETARSIRAAAAREGVPAAKWVCTAIWDRLNRGN